MANVLDREKQISVIHHLAEGNSIRATSRLTRVHRNTIMDLLTSFGSGCHHFMDLSFGNLRLDHLQIDEIWTFCQKKHAKLIGFRGIGLTISIRPAFGMHALTNCFDVRDSTGFAKNTGLNRRAAVFRRALLAIGFGFT